MSRPEEFKQSIIDEIPTVIKSGNTKSEIIDTYGVSIVLIQFPSEFTGTAVTFETSHDSSNWGEYRNIDNVPVSIDPVDPGIHYGIAAQDFFPVRYAKIVSNAVEAADRNIILIPKSI